MAWGKDWGKSEELALDEMYSITGTKKLNPEDALNIAQTEMNEASNKFKNSIPTHDPYTNPGAFLYYECECGQRLDPNVKSFASLNNHASEAGWKIRWGEKHYVPYCPKCAEAKGIGD